MWQLTMSGLMRWSSVAREPDLLHDAGPEVVEHDVGGRDQLAQHLLAFGAAQVERQRALVAVERREVEAEAVAHDALLAHRVAVVDVLDLDHLGAHVREEHRAERAGQDARQVDDADALQLHGKAERESESCIVEREAGRSQWADSLSSSMVRQAKADESRI